MYTSYIGKKFLKQYNERQGTNLSAREFFDQHLFPLFFRDDSHLMHVSNSPFFQKPKQEDVKAAGGTAQAQLANLHNAIKDDVPNMSIFVGYAAKDLTGTTSGQLSSLNIQPDKQEMYASWIGQALAIGVSGGFVMLIDKPELQWLLYEGWDPYRAQLEQTPGLKDKQIETWNGQWLKHCLNKRFDAKHPLRGLIIETGQTMGKLAIQTASWSEIVFSLSAAYPHQKLTVYAYNLSQTNTTLGFIQLILPVINKVYELRDILFLDQKDTVLTDEEIQQLEPYYNFKAACMYGTIGLRSLEPKGLRDYLPKGSLNWAKGNDYKFVDQQSQITFQLYKLWIMAMLNKNELLQLADGIAEALIAFEATSDRAKKVESTLSQNLRDSTNLKSFIAACTEILDRDPTNANLFKQVIDEVLLLPLDSFPLFMQLIRFQYSFRNANLNN